MPVEIEAKMKVDDLSVVRERLKQAGAEHDGAVLETNVFFDTDDRSLLAADKAGGFAAPAATSAVQSEVWATRDAKWIELDGEGTQEADK